MPTNICSRWPLAFPLAVVEDIQSPAFPLATVNRTQVGKAGRALGRVYGDPVEVWIVAGMPSRFRWNGRLYTVRRVLERWVAMRDWWHEQHLAAGDLREREFWRVEATPDHDVGIYELRHDTATGAWMLSRLWD